jgi:hypothetical protein
MPYALSGSNRRRREEEKRRRPYDTNISDRMKMRCTKKSLHTLMKADYLSYATIARYAYPKRMQGR